MEQSGAFDQKHYRKQLKKAGLKQQRLIEHYLTEGWKIGLDPHPCFSTNFYLKNNEDVQKLDFHPFIHFIMYGYREHRSTKLGFSLTDYRQRHIDVNSPEINPLAHYTQRYGQTEPSPTQLMPIPLPAKLKLDKLGEFDDILAEAVQLGLFDYEWYSATYKKQFSDIQSAFTDYLHKSRFAPINPSILFDNEHYHRTNNDVYHAQASPLHHYLASGRKEGRQHSHLLNKWTPNTTINPPTWLLPEAQGLKIAVCLHIFYGDYIDRFAKALTDFPIDVDVLITLTDARLENRARKVFGKHPRVKKLTIKCVPNHGRNFGPLLVEYGNTLLQYDLFCHLHSKKSLYSGREQTQWAEYLTEYLIQDNSVTTRLLNAFIENKELGLYYPTTFWMMPSWVNHVTMNKSHMEPWLQELEIKECDGFLSYPAGGMFWARPQALKQLLTRSHSYIEFPQEPLPNDGSPLHALERVIGLLAERNDYKQFFYYPASAEFTTDQSYITMNYHNSAETVHALLRNYGNISFDVFDTLVRREYTFPDFAKLLLGEELAAQGLVTNAQAFVNLRNDSEFALRKRSNFIGDIKIHDIYSEIGIRLGLGEEHAQKMMQREFELDLGMIVAKDEMVDLFNDLGSLGHVLWVISDTYYTRAQVGQMLRKVGITGAYRLLVSSEEQKRKDNGSMWRMVKNDLELEGVTSYIHVGDNVVADAQIPGDMGLMTMHILHPIDKWKALGFPYQAENASPINETYLYKWGKLISCVGREPFL